MGFFRRVFGGAAEPEPPPPKFVPSTFPFSGDVRMVHEDYERLATGWWRVSVNTEGEWEAKLAEMRQGIRNHYGRYLTKDGRLLPRWTDETWEFVEIGLRVEKR